MNILVKLLLLAILACFPASSMAQEAGTGLICDTADELREVIRLANESRNFEASVEKVNNGTNACAVAAVAFFRGDTVATVQTPDGKRDIVEIVVIGVILPQGFHPTTPLKQYTLFKAVGEDA